MHIDYFLKIFKKNRSKRCDCLESSTYKYDWLLERYNYWENKKKNLIISGKWWLLKLIFLRIP